MPRNDAAYADAQLEEATTTTQKVGHTLLGCVQNALGRTHNHVRISKEQGLPLSSDVHYEAALIHSERLLQENVDRLKEALAKVQALQT